MSSSDTDSMSELIGCGHTAWRSLSALCSSARNLECRVSSMSARFAGSKANIDRSSSRPDGSVPGNLDASSYDIKSDKVKKN